MFNHKNLSTYLLTTTVTLALMNPALNFKVIDPKNDGANVTFQSNISEQNVPKEYDVPGGKLINHEIDANQCLLWVSRNFGKMLYECTFTYDVKAFEELDGQEPIKAGEIDTKDTWWGWFVAGDLQTHEMIQCVKEFQGEKKKHEMNFLDVVKACPVVMNLIINQWYLPVGCTNPQYTETNGMVKESTIQVAFPQFVPEDSGMLLI